MKTATQIRPNPVDPKDAANKEYADSVGGGGGGVFSPPEKWHKLDVPASLAPEPMETLVSQTFNDIQVVRAGSVTGLNIRLTANLSGGTAIATVTVNGTPGTLSVVLTSGNSSGRSTQAIGIDLFNPGDTLGISLTTDGSYAPVTLDAEAWMELT